MCGGRRYAWWLTPTGLAVVFAALSWQVTTDGPLSRLDATVRVLALRLAHSTPAGHLLVVAGQALADLGDWRVAGPVALGAGASTGLLSRTWRPVVSVLVRVGLLAVVIPLKGWFGRPGPSAALDSHGLGFFPSGHLATAAVCFGAAGTVLGGLLQPIGRRVLIAAVCVLTCGIGAGLVLADYHWSSDVLAGAAFAGLVLCVPVVIRSATARIRPVSTGAGQTLAPGRQTWPTSF